MDIKKKKAGELAWYLLVFAFLYIWFTRVHPLVIFDADDWTYLTLDREAWPIWGEWNPAKVFPEVFMPLCSTVGNFLLMPLLDDYVTVMTVTHAFVVSVFITGYLYSFAQMLKRLFRLSVSETVCASALFLVFHFLALRTEETGNLYLFHCLDVNCYYNYLIPGLLNAGLVMWMVKNEKFQDFLKNGSAAEKGIFLLALYMAIFSNLVDSVILAVYAGAQILLGFLKQVKKPDWKTYGKEHVLYFGIFAAWFVSAIFELSGGRAGAGSGGSLLHNILNAAYCLKNVLTGCNGLFLAVCASLVVLAAVVFFQNKKQDGEFLDISILWLVCVAAMMVCMVILCAMVNPAAISRAEYAFSVFFYCLVFVLLCFGYLVQKQPKVLMVLPILLCVLASETDTKDKTFRESNMADMDPSVCAEISSFLVEQVVTADAQHQKEMTLYVPVWESEDNWPHAVQLMDRMTFALYSHGLIDYPVEITAQTDAQINETCGMPVPALLP